jgi:hypothetical protein
MGEFGLKISFDVLPAACILQGHDHQRGKPEYDQEELALLYTALVSPPTKV